MPEISQVRENLQALTRVDRKTVMLEAVEAMSEDDKQDVARRLNAPTQSVTNTIWLRVVTAFVVVFVGAFAAMAAYLYVGKPPEMLLTVFTTVAAFLAGLLAPSPVTGNSR